ncbi:hypothetical protein MNBD_GAMMA02-1051 [hydrothermal vent metagenome]|uniref:Uncharacterized protein n=1 Tax=hydrothermal vent metagenome TaxID=652676 RepID=A0A3B0WX19_9ZZZZ
MNEMLIYSGISLLCLVLFYAWYRRQGHAAEKQWLLKQINQTSGQDQQTFVDALSQLKNKPASLSVTIWMGLMIVPATFAIDYLWFHDIPLEQRISMADMQSSAEQAPDLVTAIKQLEQKLADNPEDLDGQLLYGRSMMSMQRYEYAVGAYQKANQLDPNNANILTELAEAIAFRNNTGSFLGEPEQYLSQAIAIDPKQQKAMWLQGIVYFENLEYQQAEDMWTDLLALVDSPSIKSTVIKQINQALEAQNKPAINIDSSNVSTTGSFGGYFVVINASEEIKAMKLNPAARLFVYAKQVNGPPMPIAAVPLSQPFSWPMSVRINDSNSLNPERKLSAFEQVEFSAKLSFSGSATPADDDIVSELKTGNSNALNIQLTLNK